MICAISRSLGGVNLDLVLSEEHSSDLTISDHAVEGGQTMSDHAFLESAELVLEGFISPQNINPMNAWGQLKRLQATLEPFEIVTGLEIYRSMMIMSLTSKRDDKSGQGLQFTAMLRQVKRFNDQGALFSGFENILCPPLFSRGDAVLRPLVTTALDLITTGQANGAGAYQDAARNAEIVAAMRGY